MPGTGVIGSFIRDTNANADHFYALLDQIRKIKSNETSPEEWRKQVEGWDAYEAAAYLQYLSGILDANSEGTNPDIELVRQAAQYSTDQIQIVAAFEAIGKPVSDAPRPIAARLFDNVSHEFYVQLYRSAVWEFSLTLPTERRLRLAQLLRGAPASNPATWSPAEGTFRINSLIENLKKGTVTPVSDHTQADLELLEAAGAYFESKVQPDDPFIALARQNIERWGGILKEIDRLTESVRPSAARPVLRSVADYVSAFGGDPSRVIQRVLIANNGMAAVKGIQSIRKWALDNLGDERAIEIVVMASSEDIEANAEFIRLADEVEEVPGGPNFNNYANIGLIVETALKYKVDAVWPGWGHASENPLLPRALKNAGIIFMGPEEKPMRALGDKIASLIVAQSSGVSVIGWSGDGAIVDYKAAGQVPQELYVKASVRNLEEAKAQARRIGYPVMLKAAGTGGGRGMRKVHNDEEMEAAWPQVVNESAGSDIFVMKLASPRSRHIEVQVVGDNHGNVITLFERDCSIQRRHQKIIEEAGDLKVPYEVRLKMRQQAAELARTVGYSGMGTVEFLYDPDSNEFYFLELNSRLQVEHPATEGVTGLNLPAIQLAVSMDVPLDRIPEVRKHLGADPYGNEPVDLSKSATIQPKGHTIAVRITAEDADAGFKLTSGAITDLRFNDTPNVWGYFSVGPGSSVHQFADSQIGHLFAWGETREEARKNMLFALQNLIIRGEIRTNREYVIELLKRADYIDADFNISWLDGLIAQRQTAEKPEHDLAVLSAALYRAFTVTNAQIRQYASEVKNGQNPPASRLSNEVPVELIYQSENGDYKYELKVSRTSENSYTVYLNGSAVEAQVRKMANGSLRILIDGQNHVIWPFEEEGGLRLEVDGKTAIFPKEYDPSKLKTPMPGKLVRYLVKEGEKVKKGQPVAIVEAMKMENSILADEDGTVHLVRKDGDSLSPGNILIELELDNPNAVRKATPYPGRFQTLRNSPPEQEKAAQAYQVNLGIIHRLLSGFGYPDDQISSVLSNLDNSFWTNLNDPLRPYQEFEKILQNLASKLPQELQDRILAILKPGTGEFPVAGVQAILESHLSALEEKERKPFQNTVKIMTDFLAHYQNGMEGAAIATVQKILEQYLEVEELYDRNSGDNIVAALRARQSTLGSWEKVHDIARAHELLGQRNSLVGMILNQVNARQWGAALEPVIQRLAGLSGDGYREVAHRAREMLLRYGERSFDVRSNEMRSLLTEVGDPTLKPQTLPFLVGQTDAIYDVLVPYLWASDAGIREAALETYVNRSYRSYAVDSFIQRLTSDLQYAHWTYGYQNLAHAGESREGTMLVVSSPRSLEEQFSRYLRMLRSDSRDYSPEFTENSLTIALSNAEEKLGDADLEAIFDRCLQKYHSNLERFGVGRVTFLVNVSGSFPRYFTFKRAEASAPYRIDRRLQDVDPPLAYQMELRRLDNFDIQPYPKGNHRVRIYFGEGKKGKEAAQASTDKKKEELDRRFFVRGLIRQAQDIQAPQDGKAPVSKEIEGVFVESLRSLSLAVSDPAFPKTNWNQIFLNVLPDINAPREAVEAIIRELASKYANELRLLRVAEVEVKVGTARYFASHVSDSVVRIEGYRQVLDPQTGKTLLKPLNGGEHRLADSAIADPYAELNALAQKRLRAQSKNTTYVYDIPELFQAALQDAWGNKAPEDAIQVQELTLNEAGELVATDRPAGRNNVGMVAWRLTLKTPEHPEGRDVILTANDITHQSGSFSEGEDAVYQKAVEMASREGIPSLFFAANSGARIGLAREVWDKLEPAWKADGDFDYHYLKDEDYQNLKASVEAERVVLEDGTVRWKVPVVIGIEHGLNQENLRGSGLIAAETSKASRKTFTLTYVMTDDVGIGAYLTRLGLRVVQKEGAPILLTGEGMIARLYGGKKVYKSNNELGGADKIMSPNGVTHRKVKNDVQGAKVVLNWVRDLPKAQGQPLPIRATSDPIDRTVEALPTEKPYDPRHMLAGYTEVIKEEKEVGGQKVIEERSVFRPGLLDTGSFEEYLADWAKTVVVGRGGLGGIPTGIISVETRPVQKVIPADPAVEGSQERVITQYGKVWYPDSAFKTAQFIKDIKAEGKPLVIMANWRGFDGGATGMFEEVLKFGSFIVDELVDFDAPVVVYIPRFGELRGGSWVVIDPSINPDEITMFADPRATAGVLEPDATADLKISNADLVKKMHQVDDKLVELDRQLKEAKQPFKPGIQKEIKEREAKLLPAYRKWSVAFARQHDDPRRMKAKGVISDIVAQEQSREFIYWHMKVRLEENSLRDRIRKADPTLSKKEARALVNGWLKDREPDFKGMTDAKQWLSVAAKHQEALENEISQVRANYIARRVRELVGENPAAGVLGLINGLIQAGFLENTPPPADGPAVLAALAQQLPAILNSQQADAEPASAVNTPKSPSQTGKAVKLRVIDSSPPENDGQASIFSDPVLAGEEPAVPAGGDTDPNTPKNFDASDLKGIATPIEFGASKFSLLDPAANKLSPYQAAQRMLLGANATNGAAAMQLNRMMHRQAGEILSKPPMPAARDYRLSAIPHRDRHAGGAVASRMAPRAARGGVMRARAGIGFGRVR